MPETARSPLAPARFPKLPPVAGVRLAAGRAGVRYRGRDDVLFAAFARGTAAAGVFTRSTMPGAPVLWCREILPRGRARGLVVSAGNANVFTGRAGEAEVRAEARAAGRLLGAPARDVFVAATGVIGEVPPAGRVAAILPGLHDRLDAGAWRRAAGAIMTTDTFPKGASRTCRIAGRTVTINGIAKGSGMIAPDMATLLAFLFTDARIPAEVLQSLLVRANESSFNALTVDGDTSTSDSVLLFATGRARHDAPRDARDPRLAGFRAALLEVMQDLARQVVRDGEGASRFVTVTVTGARSRRAARAIARSIANSPLVKTAIAGGDANWGRIVMAVGKAGEEADRDRLGIAIGGVPVAEGGRVRPDYDEARLAPHMEGSEIDIAVDVGVGRGRATVWTCDLTHGYIDINADYRS